MISLIQIKKLTVPFLIQTEIFYFKYKTFDNLKLNTEKLQINKRFTNVACLKSWNYIVP